MEIDDIVTAALFALGEVPPRFLFAVGAKGAVLRSADRGATWRKLQTWKASSPPQPNDGPTEQLNDIINLLPGAQGSSDANAAEDAPPDLHCSACRKDMIAVCGSNGFVGLSCDRGVTFCVASREILANLGVKDRTKSANEFLSLRGVCFTSDTTLLVYGGSTLMEWTFFVRSLTLAEFVSARVVHRFSGPIGMLQSAFEEGSSGGCHIFVSVKGLLYVRWASLPFFVEIRHTLGLMRVLCPLDKFRVPPFPDPPPVTDKPKQFTYFASHAIEAAHFVLLDAAYCSLSFEQCQAAFRSLASLPSGCMAVLCTEGQIADYDFTALWYFKFEFGPNGEIQCLTTAVNADHIAFVKSGHQEKVGLTVVEGLIESSCVWLRATISGFSTSSDLGVTWTVPSQSFMVASTSLGRASFVVCNTRNFVAVSENCGQTFKSYAIPSTLRVVSLNHASVMH
jgi:hypothetical protein